MGMDAATGKTLTGLDDVRQSVHDIITTPIGTRVMRRDYGCGIWDMVDAPINAEFRLGAAALVADALARFEPRVEVTRVTVESAGDDGKVSLNLFYTYLNQPQTETVTL